MQGEAVPPGHCGPNYIHTLKAYYHENDYDIPLEDSHVQRAYAGSKYPRSLLSCFLENAFSSLFGREEPSLAARFKVARDWRCRGARQK